MKESRDYFNKVLLGLPSKPFFAAKKTDPVELRRLLGALAPVQTGCPLIRLGPANDGGYLVPDDLNGITTCFSPGVSTLSGFELDCAARGMDIFMADASVEAPPDQHSRFKFLKKYLGAFTQGEFITMENWVNQMNPDFTGDWLLQIDIEGAEYEVLLNMPEQYLRQSRIIVIEFHKLDYLFDLEFYNIASRVFQKLLNEHTCVHIHPNNSATAVSSDGIEIPKTLEFSFYRNDRVGKCAPATRFPHPLDSESVPHFPHMKLPACWYG